MLTIYTDGACVGKNPGGYGGWAFVIEGQGEGSGAQLNTTNNRMELMAAIQALKAVTTPSVITLYSDSQYVVKGMSMWIQGWKRKGWVTTAKEPVKNAELWLELEREALKHSVKWRWIKGHAGNPPNERCDLLANLAAYGAAVN